MTNILIHGFYNAGTIGDDAILHSLIEQLYSEFPRCQVTVCVRRKSMKPYHGTRLIRYAAGANLQALHCELKRSDMVVIAGGELFQDYQSFHVLQVLKRNRGSIPYCAAPLILAHSLNIPIMLYGVGIGPLQSPEAAQMAAFLIQLADKITVRDTRSLRWLQGMGITQVVLSADPAVNLAFIDNDGPDSTLKSLLPPAFQKNDNYPVIGINYRSWPYGTYSTSKAFELLIGVSKYLIDRYHAKLVVLPFNHSKEELSSAKQFVLHFPREHTHLAAAVDSPVLMKHTIGQLDFIINMRLHASILALSEGVPALALSYDSKVTDLYDELQLAELCLALDEADLSILIARADAIIADREALSSTIIDSFSRLQLWEKQNMQLLKKVLYRQS